MLAKTICFFRGYVEVIVNSRFIERFINICIRHNIYLWDIRYKNECEAKMKMSIKSYHKIRPIAKKTHSRVHILKKNGAPMLFHKYKKRYFFMWGFIVALLFLFIMSRFVWSIEVVGNERVSSEKILQTLSELGFKKGCYKNKFDPKDLKNNALVKLDELSWIWVDVRGSKAIVSVNEKKPAPEVINKNEMCDIVASRAGVIKSIMVKEGQSRVEIGQTVMEGQLLISGVIQSERIEPRYTHAVGEVIARTWYEQSDVYPLYEQIRTPTGSVKKRNTLYIGGMGMNFFVNAGNIYENYDTTEEKHDLVIFGHYMGLSWKTVKYAEVTVTHEAITAEQAMEKAKDELIEKISPISGEKAVLEASNLSYTIHNDDSIKVIMTAEYSEPIGQQKLIQTVLDTRIKNTTKE